MAAIKMVIRNWCSMDRKMAEMLKTKRSRTLLLAILEGVMVAELRRKRVFMRCEKEDTSRSL
jgi:hypothetical protein